MKLQLKHNHFLLLRCLPTLLFLAGVTVRISLCFSGRLSLDSLPLDGTLTFELGQTARAARDFGNRLRNLPKAVLHPRTVSDIAITVKHVYSMGAGSELTVAARGHGHSLMGQSQAHRGVVISMESLKTPGMRIHVGESDSEAPYVDVSGGELWINILRETLKLGYAPKSWTDYLHLTVGGTLSNAGVSGQAFRHGPQISNVHRLEVVTGKGDVVNCSKEENEDLFHGVLGGLGQFGIITRARISLEKAPKTVKWIRVLYADFETFTRDQERLISAEPTFDYIEGFVIINRTGLLNNWRSSFDPQDPAQASQFKSDGKTLFCLELAKYVDERDTETANQEVRALLSRLSFIASTLFVTEAPYLEFLDRVHKSEIQLRAKGLWEVPHPWLNLLIPQSKIHAFADEVFGKILTQTSNGPVLIYPVHKSKWDNRTSVVLPEGEIFYLVAFLSSAVPDSRGSDGLDAIVEQNERILEFCGSSELGVKQYLGHFRSEQQWRTHFGHGWEAFARRKAAYDPFALLGPGQGIFRKGVNSKLLRSSS